jgi:hypothetical protein
MPVGSTVEKLRNLLESMNELEVGQVSHVLDHVLGREAD